MGESKDSFLSDANYPVRSTGIATRAKFDHIGAPEASKLTLSEKPSADVLASTSVEGLVSVDKEKQLRGVYEQLDIDKDGKVDIKDLVETFKARMPEHPAGSPVLAERMMDNADVSRNREISFREFVAYSLEHEKKLALVFKDVDRDRDGVIDAREIMNYFRSLGMPLTHAQAHQMLKKMQKRRRNKLDTDSSYSIDLKEWTDFFLMNPSLEPHDMVAYWEHYRDFCVVPPDFSEKQMAGGVWWRHLVAGGLAGAVSRTATAPMDRLKIFLQVYGSKRIGFITGLQMLVKEGGVRALWRGNGVNVIKIAPESAIKFMAYDAIKKRIKGKSTEELSLSYRFLAGGTAGLVSQTVIYPLEVLKTRLALGRTGELPGGFGGRMYHTFVNIIRKEGWSAVFRGYVPNCIGIFPYAGLDLAIYETLKKLYIRKYPTHKEPHPIVLLACGTTSSTCGQLFTYPLALVRTRLQAHSRSQPTSRAETMVGQFRTIWKHEGVFGLYRGIIPNYLKVLPAVSISYIVYEEVRKRLGVTMS